MTYEQVYEGITPIPKGRPRFTRTGHTYTPPRTAFYERTIRNMYKGPKFEGAIGMHVIFGMPIPKSTNKADKEKMLAGEIAPISKRSSDLDNMLKAVSDGGNGVMFDDDSQIAYVTAEKAYAEVPYVKVRIWNL